ncbi:MAG: sodium:alanine symporter family protein, partial [Bacteroidales bacterium]|nr:sodium:alanine symporter family protein [Bacteroidales bacterium]
MDSFLSSINDIISLYNNYVGGYLLLLILVPTGIYFSIKFKFLPVWKIRHSFNIIRGKYDNVKDDGEINHFKALTVALSATVGTGNIVGVALAIYYGGPGAVFWMWVTGLLGMVLKYTECTLSMKYRKIHKDGTVSGGPMYYMAEGLKNKLGKGSKILAVFFAIATILCSLGTGNMAQSNSISHVMFYNYNIPTWLTGVIISSVVFLIIIGGLKRIAKLTSALVPFMALLYFFFSIIIIAIEYKNIPVALSLIVTDAFTGTAITGGFAGSTFFMAMLYGVRRGLFSNEAGQGSAAIAHAACKTNYPAREGMVASIGPFVDTLIICTLTALVIILTGAWNDGIQGVEMTVDGFGRGLSVLGLQFLGKHIVAAGLFLFAFSTIISWSYYGDRAAEFLLGPRFITPYRYLYILFIFFGSVWGLELV